MNSPTWVQSLPLVSELNSLQVSLRHRVAREPEALARLPEVRRLPTSKLSLEDLQAKLPGRQSWFRTQPPAQFSAALFCEREGWVLYLPQTQEASVEGELYMRACLHLWLGHLSTTDDFGLWLEPGSQRRWDLEVANFLPSRSPGAISAQAWAGLRFLEQVPWMSDQVPFAPSLLPIKPWPHQRRVARELVHRFPERFLLCDEVGLGKTIEAGLALRQLLHRRLVRRVLLLVPKSVLPQWQEEMQEKFNLHFQIVEGPHVDWEQGPLILASSYLVRRQDRMKELLQATPWDLVIVDEAHHARGNQGPNRLLQLLQRLQRRTRGLWLLTATPLQIELLEVHDLLCLLGIRGEFAKPKVFDAYFKRLSGEMDLEAFQVLAPWHRNFEDEYGEIKKDERAQRVWLRHFGDEIPLRIRKFLREPKQDHWNELQTQQKEVLRQVLLRRTPLHRSMFRNTRALLRRYYREGLIDQAVPTRRVEACAVKLSELERQLYDHIETYLRDLEAAGQQLGVPRAECQRLRFLTDIYRRRLTSSLRGIQVSLQRRQLRLEEFLKGRTWSDDLSDDEDEGAEDELSERSPSEHLARLELSSLKQFAESLQALQSDSKQEQVENLIKTILGRHDRILVFTQYTDTLDSLRDQLSSVYPRGEIGCYTGRGGEVWGDSGWEKVTKETIKTRFHNPHDLRLLLCTDAASEGLNFQACGVLINYDLPWNPMRVEQRIGRIDRIGQLHLELEIYNFFYEDSVEARIYQQLGARIDLFQAVVGNLQPILARIEQSIQELARVPAHERDERTRELVERLGQELEETQQQAPPIDPEVEEEDLNEPSAPDTVSPSDLQRLFMPSPDLEPADMPGVYRWRGLKEVTFDPNIADDHPDSLALVSYGSPVFEELTQKLKSSVVEEAPGCCSLEAWSGELGLGEIRFWDGERWQSATTLETCLSSNPANLPSILPSIEPVKKALMENLKRYGASQSQLVANLEGNQHIQVSDRLCNGLALHVSQTQMRVGMPWEPVVGTLGALYQGCAELFAHPVLKRLLAILGTHRYGFSLNEEIYWQFQEDSLAQLQGKWAKWVQQTQVWLDEQEPWCFDPGQFSHEVEICVRRPGMVEESQ